MNNNKSDSTSKTKLTKSHIHQGVHYLTIVCDIEDKENGVVLTKEEIKAAEEDMSKELGGVPVIFIGVDYE